MMAEKSLRIWCNAKFPDDLSRALERSVAPHALVWSSNSQKSNLATVGPDEDARSADIVYGQPHPEDVIHSSTMRWVHLTTAGYTRYDNDEVRNALRARGAVLTNSSTVFADPCAEHILSFMLCAARALPPAIVNDATAHGWPYMELRSAPCLLRGQSAVLVGFGAIARRLIELLAQFQMNLSAVRRSVHGDEPVRTFASSQLDDAIADADHIINILPAAAGTTAVFNAARFARMKRGAIFYNVGRGDTVDQDALCDALESGKVRGAYLDVTTPEPLPSDHRLWKVPNCWITPHVAGGHDREAQVNVEHFVSNFGKFVRGNELRDRIL
jgi:phosphoglycerate dehydrogenase-like enzyme